MRKSISKFFCKYLSKRHLIYLITCLSFSSTLLAQVNVSHISVTGGIIQNHQVELAESQFAFYPEIGLGGLIFQKYIEWNFNFGYWDDGVKTPFNVMDLVTYSYSCTIITGKLTFLPQNAFEHFFLPIHFNAGFSYHYISQKYIGGTDLNGNYIPPHDYKIPAFDFGVGLNMKIYNSLRLRVDGDLYLPFNKYNSFPNQSNSSSLKCGLDYFIF